MERVWTSIEFKSEIMLFDLCLLVENQFTLT